MSSSESYRLTPTEYLRYSWRKLTRPHITRIGNSRVYVTSDLPKGVRKALYKGTYEYAERSLVRRKLKQNDRVLEIGSGIGVVALECAHICGPNSLRCYEANPSLGEKIRQNFELNGWKAPLKNRAVTRNGGEVQFHFANNFISSSLIDRNKGQATSVPSESLSDVLASFQPDTLIMDTEGAEVDLLSGLELATINKIIIELHPWIVGQEPIKELIDHLKAEGLTHQTEDDLGDVAYFRGPTGRNDI